MPTPETLAQRLRLNSAPQPSAQPSRITRRASLGNGNGRKDLSQCSRAELLTILDRNEETLKNERLVSALPDKGQKLKDTITQIRSILAAEQIEDIDHKLQHVSIEPDRKLRKTASVEEGTEQVSTNDGNVAFEEENTDREQRRRRKSDGGPREMTDLSPRDRPAPSQNHIPGNTTRQYRAVPHSAQELCLAESVALQTEHRRIFEEAQLRASMARLNIIRENQSSPHCPTPPLTIDGKDDEEGSSGEYDTDFSDDSGTEGDLDSELDSEEDEEKQYAMESVET